MSKPILLVTGGAGFIGSHVVERALGAGYEVAVFDNFSSGAKANLPSDVRVFEGDLRDRGRVLWALGSLTPNYVSHHAALIDSPGSCKKPREHFETNVMGSINLLDACAAVGSVKRIVFASSAAIYGDAGSRDSDETTLPAPQTPYGVGKLAVEHLFAAMYQHSGIECVSLRYPNVYGPRAKHGVVAKFIQAARLGNDVYVQHAPPECGWEPPIGTQRQYAYVGDVADANVRALGTHIVGCSVYNVPGSTRNTTEVATLILDRIPGSCLKRAPCVPGDVARSRMLTHRFREDISITTTDFHMGLDKTIAWWKKRL